jgi:hypothetical protein
MPDGIDPAMKTMQAASSHAPHAPTLVNAYPFELHQGDNSVLIRGDPGDQGIRGIVGEFPTHVGR